MSAKQDMKQIFESENISFVEISETLAQDYLLMVNDDEHVNKYIGGRYGGSSEPYTEEQEIQWVRSKLAENAPVFSMIEKSSNKFIGNTEFMNPTDTEGELGIALTALMQDKGYGTEAVLAVTKYGFERLGFTRVFLRTRTYNSRAIHVYEKCGFKEYNRDDEHVFMEKERSTEGR